MRPGRWYWPNGCARTSRPGIPSTTAARCGLTISLGLAVAEVNTPAAYEELRDCAAEALREAKENGRNRAVIRTFSPAIEDTPPAP